MKDSQDRRVVIIGGGIVGLHLARILSEKGMETELHESKKDVSEGADRASGILSVSGLGRRAWITRTQR